MESWFCVYKSIRSLLLDNITLLHFVYFVKSLKPKIQLKSSSEITIKIRESYRSRLFVISLWLVTIKFEFFIITLLLSLTSLNFSTREKNVEGKNQECTVHVFQRCACISSLYVIREIPLKLFVTNWRGKHCLVKRIKFHWKKVWSR